MRLLFSSCLTDWGGGENWMLSTALGMRERGHAVHLACAEGGELGRRAAEAGLPVTSFRFHGDLDPALSWRYWRLCRRERIDLMCLNMDKVLRVAGPAARLAGATVVPRRGSESPVGGKISHKLSYRSVAAGVIVNSKATRDTMLDSAPWLPADKLRVIYNGIHVERYDADPALRAAVRAELDTPDDAPVIGMVGELTDRKNHRLIVEQLPDLLRVHPGLRLWIVGEGPQRGDLERAAADAGTAAALRLLGFRDDVPRLLQGMDLYCHPALREGFGYAIVEAMASGLPVIVSNASNLPELVDDGETGQLCDPQNGVDWREKIGTLLADREAAGRLASRGRDDARSKFSFTRMLDEVEAYFLELRT